jgi:tetratricopeptide (TPR) repeat protein
LARLLAADADGAVSAYTRGLTAIPDSVELGSELAEVHARLGRFEEAIAAYDRLLAARPDVDLAANNLAVLLATHRRDADSQKRALELAERFARSANPAYQDTYGWVLYGRGDYARAVEVLSDVVAAAPSVAIYRYHLGMAQHRLGDGAAAKVNLEAALAGERPFSGGDEARATLALLRSN